MNRLKTMFYNVLFQGILCFEINIAHLAKFMRGKKKLG